MTLPAVQFIIPPMLFLFGMTFAFFGYTRTSDQRPSIFLFGIGLVGMVLWNVIIWYLLSCSGF